MLQSKGDVFKRDFAQACPPNVPNHLLAQAAKHKIEGFATLFAKEADLETKIATTKKSLSENNPVVIGMQVPPSFDALNYKSNEVALPAENKYITMDNVKGTDVFCLLYSKEPLEIKTICRQMEAETGTFFQRLYKTLSDKLVAPEHLRYYNDSVKFEVNSHGKSVVPIVVQIPHH